MLNQIPTAIVYYLLTSYCQYMSYFFKGTELPFRLALFWMANRLTDVVAPLLAYGLLRLRGYHGYEGWRW